MFHSGVITPGTDTCARQLLYRLRKLKQDSRLPERGLIIRQLVMLKRNQHQLDVPRDTEYEKSVLQKSTELFGVPV